MRPLVGLNESATFMIEDRPAGTTLDGCVPLDDVAIRPARTDEIDAILALFEDEVRAGRMLPRSPNEIRATIDDWLVAASDDVVVGCVSLVFFKDELCEVRSLAVAPACRGIGLGAALVEAALALARRRDMRRVLTLTRAVDFFRRLGFRIDRVARYPEKVWRDCRPCPLRHRCDEVALIYYLKIHPPRTRKDGSRS
jgi:amino-acid N-acetyltransferase